MQKLKKDCKGFTLIETTVCFAILGILLVVVSQIIHSCTEVYYNTKSTGFGIQAGQIVATEVRGDIEDALPLTLIDSDPAFIGYVRIGSDGKSIEFISQKGDQIKYSFEASGSDSKLVRQEYYAYDQYRLEQVEKKGTKKPDSKKEFDSKYIGVGYRVKDITFSYEKEFSVNYAALTDDKKLPISDYPVLKMVVKVGNNQFDDYECVEYIPLYNLYGLDLNARIVEVEL